jgi:oligo-1,6-glucosidase
LIYSCHIVTRKSAVHICGQGTYGQMEREVHPSSVVVSDYYDVDPLFGTLEQLEELIAELHARGMKLVMDLVVNHTSSALAWFAESRSSRDSPKRDWYWWRSPRPGHEPGSPGAEPTSWGSAFSGPAWAYDDHTGEYYLHVFASDQPELNWENPEVRQAVYAMMRDWLDRGVDGFRMGVINVISKVVGPVGADGWVTLPDGVIGGQRDPRWPGVVRHGQLRRHAGVRAQRTPDSRVPSRDAPRGLRRSSTWTTQRRETPGCPVEEAVLYTDPERGELDMVFQFQHIDLDSGPQGKWDVLPMTTLKLKQSLGRWQDGLADSLWRICRPQLT